MLLRWILSTGGWSPNILASATTARTNRGLVVSQNTFLHCAFQMLFSTVRFQMTNSRSTLLWYEIYQIWPFEVGISFFTKFYIVRFRFCSSALYLCWYSRGFTAEVLWWFQTLKTSLSLLCTIESKQLELTGPCEWKHFAESPNISYPHAYSKKRVNKFPTFLLQAMNQLFSLGNGPHSYNW